MRILKSDGLIADADTCKQKLADPIEVDHIVPISRGGSHTYDNLQAAHANCNRKKWAKAA